MHVLHPFFIGFFVLFCSIYCIYDAFSSSHIFAPDNCFQFNICKIIEKSMFVFIGDAFQVKLIVKRLCPNKRPCFSYNRFFDILIGGGGVRGLRGWWCWWDTCTLRFSTCRKSSLPNILSKQFLFFLFLFSP